MNALALPPSTLRLYWSLLSGILGHRLHVTGEAAEGVASVRGKGLRVWRFGVSGVGVLDLEVSGLRL